MMNSKTQKQPQVNKAVASQGSPARIVMMPDGPSHEKI
jgi:hypothetical protein